MNNIYEAIAKKTDVMSKSQKKIAEYILMNRDTVAFMNVKKLAREADVSDASITRFAAFMGYKGYPQLRNDLREKTREQLSIRDRLAISYDEYNENDAGIAKIFNEDANRIKATLSNLDFNTFHMVVEKILAARKIYIISGRSAAALGKFFHYYLNMVLGNVEQISASDGKEMIMYDICEKDVVIAITFSRYTKKTVELFNYAQKKGAENIAITDSMTSPVIKNAKYYFLMETQLNTYLDSFVAPLSLINALLTYIGRYKNMELEEKFSELEEIWDEFDIFW